MKLRQLKYFLLTITFFLQVITNVFSQDLLDNVQSHSKLVFELKDTYRAFHINNIIIDQKEFINVFFDESSAAEINTTLNSYIKKCESLKQIGFNDKTLNAYVNKYLSLTIQSYRIAKTKGFSSPAFKKDFAEYIVEKEKYMNYLYGTYSTNHFINMTEEKYWQTIDKKNYTRSPEYPRYKRLKVIDLKTSLALLDSISKRSTDFQEYSIYQIELADQYVKHPDSLKENADEIAIAKYKAILDQKKYCIYLFESWVKWRTVTQQINGLSKSSDIPNDEYDKMREQVALIILAYIINNEKDEMAINEFLLIATHDIIKRVGDYPYGNQNTVEYHQIFDEKK